MANTTQDVHLRADDSVAHASNNLNLLSREQVLEERYSTPSMDLSNLVFEYTKDPALLQQYYELRASAYRRVWQLDDFPAQEDKYDQRSHILVVRNGNLVIGGVRLTVKTPRRALSLPMEQNGFSLSAALPSHGLEYLKHGELSRLVIPEEYTQTVLLTDIIRQLHRKANALGLSYLFAIGPAATARHYRRCYHALDHNFGILNEVEIPEEDGHFGIRMYLMYSEMEPEALNDAQIPTEIIANTAVLAH